MIISEKSEINDILNTAIPGVSLSFFVLVQADNCLLDFGKIYNMVFLQVHQLLTIFHPEYRI